MTAQGSIFVMRDAWGELTTWWVLNSSPGEDSGIARFSHIPGGCNTLYMDGHVEYVRKDAEFPVTDTIRETLRPNSSAADKQ